MASRVLRYQFDVRNPVVTLPKHFRILHLAHQPGTSEELVNVWCKVIGDPEPVRELRFEVFQTDQDMPVEWPPSQTSHGSYLKHVGTAICPTSVWHVFVRRILPALSKRNTV